MYRKRNEKTKPKLSEPGHDRVRLSVCISVCMFVYVCVCVCVCVYVCLSGWVCVFVHAFSTSLTSGGDARLTRWRRPESCNDSDSTRAKQAQATPRLAYVFEARRRSTKWFLAFCGALRCFCRHQGQAVRRWRRRQHQRRLGQHQGCAGRKLGRNHLGWPRRSPCNSARTDELSPP